MGKFFNRICKDQQQQPDTGLYRRQGNSAESKPSTSGTSPKFLQPLLDRYHETHEIKEEIKSTLVAY